MGMTFLMSLHFIMLTRNQYHPQHDSLSPNERMELASAASMDMDIDEIDELGFSDESLQLFMALETVSASKLRNSVKLPILKEICQLCHIGIPLGRQTADGRHMEPRKEVLVDLIITWV